MGLLLFMITTMVSELVADCESVAVRVIEWVPEDSVLNARLVPVPNVPDRLDVQLSDEPVRVPSSASVDVPLNVIVSPLLKDEPSVGAVIVAAGKVLLMVIMTESVPVPGVV